jgi:hypothetical protein
LFPSLPAFAQAQPDIMALKGRWFRTDGSNVIEIKSADPAGRLVIFDFNAAP